MWPITPSSRPGGHFHIRHRGERRGVGGLFFDDVNEASKDECFAFVEACAGAFLPSYLPILERRKDMPYTDDNAPRQQSKSGRYVEFNSSTTVARPSDRFNRRVSIMMSLQLTIRGNTLTRLRRFGRGGFGRRPPNTA